MANIARRVALPAAMAKVASIRVHRRARSGLVTTVLASVCAPHLLLVTVARGVRRRANRYPPVLH